MDTCQGAGSPQGPALANSAAPPGSPVLGPPSSILCLLGCDACLGKGTGMLGPWQPPEERDLFGEF